MIKFGENILSKTVQRDLGRATLDLSTTSERLASGQRINKASDAAAGVSISASLNVNARIFTQGVRNLNDGLSAVNIKEFTCAEGTRKPRNVSGTLNRVADLSQARIIVAMRKA